MSINEKLRRFLNDEKISYTTVAELYGKTPQYISNTIREGKVPLDMLIMIKQHYPQLDLNKLVSAPQMTNYVSEPSAEYETGTTTRTLKEEILAEIGEILDRKLR